jgi:hypothetical protein
MNAADFNLVVIPLAALVFALVAGMFLVLKKGEIANKRKKRRIEAALKKKNKQRELTEKQLTELDLMHSNKTIDSDTYTRLQTLVKMSVEKEAETEAELMKIWET